MEETKETVGKVELRMDAYEGEDSYSDGPLEREMLRAAQSGVEPAWNSQMYAWPYVYHFHPARWNLLSWYPFAGDEHVLEIGSGCGALTGLFAERCASVTCCELSYLRSRINAERWKEKANLEIHVGDFARFQAGRKYNIATLIGVLEYAGGYYGAQKGNAAEALLRRAASFLCDHGLLFLAIENKFGLKYWAGAREDHTGRLFDSIEGYQDTLAETFSRPELIRLLKRAGFTDLKMYYPFPDYKFTEQIYSDRRLPRAGELDGALRNYDQSRLVVFDETKAWNQIVQADAFPFFSNSFLLIARREEAEKEVGRDA